MVGGSQRAAATRSRPAQTPPDAPLRVEELLTERIARERRERAPPPTRPRPARPTLVLMAGQPLGGKSTLARRLAGTHPEATLLVENDDLREKIAHALHHGPPTYDGQENFLTYRAAALLAARALAAGVHVIHDATNLNEGQRKGIYAVGDAAGARVPALVVRTPFAVREARAAGVPEGRRLAHRKLGARQADPARVTRAHLALDGTEPVEAMVARALAAWEPS